MPHSPVVVKQLRFGVIGPRPTSTGRRHGISGAPQPPDRSRRPGYNRQPARRRCHFPRRRRPPRGRSPPHAPVFVAGRGGDHVHVHRAPPSRGVPRRVRLLPRRAPACRVPSATFLEHTRLLHGALDEDGAAAAVVSFTAGVLERSGLGEETSVPPSLRYVPPDQSLRAAREEAELVVFSAMDALFAKVAASSRAPAGPGDVDAMIVCCSMCAPELALSDMIVNRYAMRSDVRSVNLSGMGCGAGLIAVGLALVVSTEILSSNYYVGTDRSMLAANCTFRMSGAATLLSTSATGARFRLGCAVRTCSATEDAAYRSVFQEEDDEGNVGARVDRDFVAVAGEKIRSNIVAFAPRVLPASELLLLALSAAARRILMSRRVGGTGTYRPNFRRAFEHFCVHAVALGVVDTVQRGIGLSDGDVEASRMTLHRFGNTSSSSVLYELAYIEAKGTMRKGDRVWMISFGAGFDCNSVAWECVKPAADADGPWVDCIHRYPVRVAGGKWIQDILE